MNAASIPNSPTMAVPAPVPTPFLPRRSAHIPSRTLMHGSPWLRASEVIRVRRRQNVEVGLGDSSVLIGVLSGEFVLKKLLRKLLRLPHDFPHYPSEVLNRAARIFGVGGYMLGDRLLHRRGLVVAFVDHARQPSPLRRDDPGLDATSRSGVCLEQRFQANPHTIGSRSRGSLFIFRSSPAVAPPGPSLPCRPRPRLARPP